MKKMLLIFTIIFAFMLVGCSGAKEDNSVNMTEEEKTALFTLMQENIEGEWLSENGEEFQVTPQQKFLYQKNSGLVSLDYNLVDAFNVEVTDANGKTETKSISFEDMGDKFKLEFDKKTYYKNK
ncbi:MAG: hypothetical protein K2F59_01645 [Eubacteriales bacterium]|nr:hypothetical protein [Eubacteriales bacterium]